MKKQNLEPEFFMRHKNNKYLITCCHLIKLKEKKLIIEIWNERSYNIELKNYYSILLDKPVDISIIRLKDSEEFILIFWIMI